MSAVHVSFGTTGRRRSATIVAALRAGRYDVKAECRLSDDGTPRMFDLVPKSQIRDDDGKIPSATAIPIIRLRSLCPVLDEFDAIASVIDIYETMADATTPMQDLYVVDEDMPMQPRIRTMFAAYAVSETPEMRDRASDADHVCVVTTPTPWSAPHALVMRHPKTGGFTPVSSTEIDPTLAAMIAPSVSVTEGGKTMDGTSIETIRATFVHFRKEEAPEPINAMRTLASTPIPGIAA
jgi:hypothetical protein